MSQATDYYDALLDEAGDLFNGLMGEERCDAEVLVALRAALQVSATLYAANFIEQGGNPSLLDACVASAVAEGLDMARQAHEALRAERQ